MNKNPLANVFKTTSMSKDDIANLLKISPEALRKFEEAYASAALSDDELNSRQAAAMKPVSSDKNAVIDRLVSELVSEAEVFSYDRKNGVSLNNAKRLPGDAHVTTGDIYPLFAKENLPQCGARFQIRDTPMDSDASNVVFFMLSGYLDKSKPMESRRHFYNMFRQGLDILDLDPILYEILGCNKNSMSHWLPQMIVPVEKEGFFKIPSTKIMKVPMNMLQLSRCNYFSITPVTLNIVDQVCYQAFDLKEDETYFIKTGTYSSKFDFRNAKVTTPKEVREIGQYLLFIQNQANIMAGPLSTPCIYGVSTTNEWVVREYIEDKENNPTIYKGLPLHTEYRVFVDFDTCEVLGITPYWEPETMKKRFGEGADHNIHDLHDYAIYKSYEDTLMGRYHENRDMVLNHIRQVLDRNVDLTGQWSIDIMQNGDDFWLIDMALAENSAFYRECVPADRRCPTEEDWIPKIPEN